MSITQTIRSLRRSPGFTVAAIAVLAIAIGANTAIFSIVNTVLLRPLPYANPERLVLIFATNPSGVSGISVSVPKFEEWRKKTQSFEGIAAFRGDRFNVIAQADPEQVSGARVSSEFFDVLGSPVQAGRGFSGDDEDVAVLGAGYWKRRFGGEASMVGRTITVDGKPTTIVGIAKSGLKLPSPYEDVDIWLPRFSEIASVRPDRVRLGAGILGIVARLKPSVDRAAAQSEIDGMTQGYRETYRSNLDAPYTATLFPLSDRLVEDVRPTLLILFASVALVLLIACANAANLLLARGASRQKEIAIRAALGAGRSRLCVDILAESIVLAVSAGLIGLTLAWWAVDAFRSVNAGIPRIDELRLDFSVFAFAMTASVLTGLLFGLAPAWSLSRSSLYEVLKRRKTGTRQFLIMAEVALSLALMVGAGLLVRSLGRLSEVNPGFRRDHILTAEVALPPSRYNTPELQRTFFADTLRDAKALPGVQSVGAINGLPFGTGVVIYFVTIDGSPSLGPGRDPTAPVRIISPEYPKTLGMTLVRGRLFTDADTAGASPVSIVSETFAKEHWSPGQDPIGHRLTSSRDRIAREVVGVVADVRYSSLSSNPRSDIYLPLAQAPASTMTLVLRSGSEPAASSSLLRAVVQKIDKEQPLAFVRTMDEVVAESMQQQKLVAAVFSCFAFLAVLLAGAGIHGVIGYSVSQRTTEIGIRLALGGEHASIVRMIVFEALRPVVIGVIAGLVLAFALTRGMSTLLFGVSAHDPLTFVFVAVVITGLGLLAAYLPARRSSRVDPVQALRR